MKHKHSFYKVGTDWTDYGVYHVFSCRFCSKSLNVDRGVCRALALGKTKLL